MTGDDVIGAMLDALQNVRIPFMIVGSLATNFHGVPRSTRDADFVIQLARFERFDTLQDVRRSVQS